MNSNECKLKIKIYYKGKQFEKESEDIIPLQEIKEKSIEKFDIIKEDEKFINFEYHSNKENKNHPIKNENDIIKYADEDCSGNLFCNLELVINNPKSNLKVNKLSNEIKGEKIENKKPSNMDIKKITDKVKTDIKQDEKENYVNVINKLKLDIENINKRYNFELTNLQKENSVKEQKVKDSNILINSLEENIKKKENEIIIINSEINKLKKENEIANDQKNDFMNKYIQSSNNLKEFIEKTNKCYNNLLKVKSTFEGIIEEMKLKIDIVNGYRNEKNEEKKDMEENENIELIKNVIEQMKLQQNNEVKEKNKKLEEENKILKEQIKELEKQNKIEIESLFGQEISIFNKMYKEIKMDNEEMKQKIIPLFNSMNINEINNNKNEKRHQEKNAKNDKNDKNDKKDKNDKNEKNEKKRFILSLFNKKKNVNSNKEKDNKNKYLIINNNNDVKPKMSCGTDSNKEIFDWYNEKDINNNQNLNINTNNFYNRDKYNNLSEQLENFYRTNISKEDILKILFKIKDIILYAQRVNNIE